jgi:hypothetical protein
MVGFWTEQGLKLLPEGEVTFEGVPRRAHVIKKGGKKIGVMRYRHGDGWMVNLQGFRFETIPGKGAARFGLKHTTVKLFPNAAAVHAALKWAFKKAEEQKNGVGFGDLGVCGSRTPSNRDPDDNAG